MRNTLRKGCHIMRGRGGVSGAAHGRTGSLGFLSGQEELHDGQARDSRIL